MIAHDDSYFMFYAANDYGGRDYAIGYARCEGPTGPCRDAAENPILKTDAPGHPGLNGPGHESVFELDGHSYIAYHAWRHIPFRERYRAMYISPLDWPDGRPVVGSDQPTEPPVVH